MAVRPDDRATPRGPGAIDAENRARARAKARALDRRRNSKPVAKQPSAAAQAWASPRTVFVPDALVPKPKPAPRSRVFKKGKGLDAPDHKALVEAGLAQAREREAISLGVLKIKDAKQPVQRQVTDMVMTGEERNASRLKDFKEKTRSAADFVTEPIGDLVQQGIRAALDAHVVPTIDGFKTPQDALDTIKYGAGQEAKGAMWLGGELGNAANWGLNRLAQGGYGAGMIAHDLLYGNPVDKETGQPIVQTAGYDLAAMKDVGAGVGKFSENLVGGTAKGLLGLGPGLVEMATDPAGFLDSMEEQYKDAYIDLLRGDMEGFKKKFLANPSQYLFDLFGAMSGLAKIGSMAGVIKAPGRVAYHTDVDGGQVQRYTSPSVLSRIIENKVTKLSEAHPDMKVVGSRTRMKGNMRLWRERDMDREMGVLADLQSASKWSRGTGAVAKARRAAVDVMLHYGPDQAPRLIHDEISFFRGKLAETKMMPASRERALTIRRQKAQIRQLEDAIALVENPPEQLTKTYELAAQASREATQTRVDAGILDPRTAMFAPQSRQRFVTPHEEIQNSPVRQLLVDQITKTYPPEAVEAAIKLHDAPAQALARTTGRSASDTYNEMWGGIVDNPRLLEDNPPPVGGKLEQRAQETSDPEIQKHYLNAARRLVRAHEGVLPENHATVTRMHKLMIKLRLRAIEAELARFWYETSAAAIKKHVGDDPVEATLLAKLIAIYSPRAEVWDKTNWNNTTRAIGAYDEYKATGQISDKWSLSKNPEGDGQRLNKDGQPHADWQTENAQRTMDGTGDWDGLKTNSFYSNFLKHIDPVKHAQEFGSHHVTIDTWMRRAFEYLKGNKEQVAEQMAGKEPTRKRKKDGTPAPLAEQITDDMYAFMQDATNIIADELGWEGEMAQAAIWTSIKSEVEGTPLSSAGIDFGYALDAVRTEHLARQRVNEILEGRPTEPNPYAHAIGEPTAAEKYETFIKDQAREQTGGASARQVRMTEERFHYLPEDDPRRLMYENLLDELDAENGHTTPDIDSLFQVAERALPAAVQGGHARVMTSAEAKTMTPSDEFVYHGTDHADTIMEGRTIQAMPDGRIPEYRDSTPPMAWLSTDPAYAAEYGSHVIEIPRSAIPDSAMALEGQKWGAGRSELMDSTTFASKEDILFQPKENPVYGEAAGRPLENLPGPVKVAGRGEVQFTAWKPAQDAAEAYMTSTGMEYDPPRSYVKVDPEEGAARARAYDNMLDINDPRATPEYRAQVLEAYQAMADETMAQYKTIVDDTGVTFEFYPKDENGLVDPYPNGPREAILDLIENKHMYVYPTNDGFGSGTTSKDFSVASNPLLADSGVKWGGEDVTINDIFRAVHDFFGHSKEGVGFRADGEDMAWRSHVSMYSPLAKKAMTSETRGQNSWVNFGPHGEKNRTALTGDTVFADQKVGILPDWVMRDSAKEALQSKAKDELPRGMVMFDADGKAYQWLNPETAGLSTVSHEAVHAMRRQLSREARAGNEPAQRLLARLELLVNDHLADYINYDKVRSPEAPLTPAGPWKRDHEELLARIMEDQLRSGNYPDPSLRSAYDLVKQEMAGTAYSQAWKDMTASEKVIASKLLDPNHGLFSDGAVYVPDTMGSPAMRALKSLPRGIRKPKKLNKRNMGIMFTAGKIRRGPRVTLEDAAAAKRMKIQLTTVDDIVEQFGKPFDPELRQGLREGYVILNPEGVKIPRSVLQEALDDPEIHPRAVADAIMTDERRMLDNLFPDDERMKNMGGDWANNAVQVPAWVKDELMYGNLKLNAGGNQYLNMLGGLFDSYNNVNRLAGIYLKPAYTIVNTASNVLFATLKQGAWYPVNLAIASGVLGSLPKALLRRLDEEVGSGGAIAISGEGKGALGTVVDAVAHTQNMLADRLQRRTAIIHELRKNGVLDIRGRGDNVARISDWLDNPVHKEMRNVIGMDAENSMVRFRGMSNVEKQVISRAIYVYPWVKGATRYGLRFGWDMPVRASVLSHIGQEGWDWVEEELGSIASFMRSKSPITNIGKDGTVRVIDPNSLTAQSSAGDVLGALLAFTEGQGAKPAFAKNLVTFATPGVGLFLGQATGTNDVGRETGNILEAFGADVPNVGFGSFVRQMIMGADDSKYYQEGGRAEVGGRFILGALYPRRAIVSEVNKAGDKQLPTVDRWIKKMKEGKDPKYTPQRVILKIVDRGSSKLPAEQALVYRVVAKNLVAEATEPGFKGLTDLASINEAIATENEIRAGANKPPIAPMTEEELDRIKASVQDAKAVVDGE